MAYTLRVDLYPDSSLARGMLEALVSNSTDRPLTSLAFNVMENTGYRYAPPTQRDSAWLDWTMPAEAACVIDSVLYRGVPCGQEQVDITDGVMRVELDNPLQPGERGHLLFSLSVRSGRDTGDVGEPAHWTECWPRALDLSTQHDSLVSGGALCTIEPADWRARVRVDSSYVLIHSGDLLNEKELYGALTRPLDDEVLLDMHRNHPFTYQGIVYRPEFPGGVARYFIDAPAETNLVLVAASDMAWDIASVGDERLSSYYPRSMSSTWERRLVVDFRQLAKALTGVTGWNPSAEMKVAAIPNMNTRGSKSLTLVPARSDGCGVRARMALGLAETYLTARYEATASSSAHTRLRAYLSVLLLYSAFGDDAAESMALIPELQFKEPE